jgi:hypothetical protein
MSGAMRCLACGELLLPGVEREMCVCGECLADEREVDHDVHIPNMQSRAVEG